LKRSLHVVDELRDPPLWTPIVVRLGRRLVSIVDTGDGTESRRLADALIEDGAVTCERDETPPTLRIVIRGAPRSAEARIRADVLEEAADLVLGAARPAFAALLAAKSRTG
jgi:hypothetical protein